MLKYSFLRIFLIHVTLFYSVGAFSQLPCISHIFEKSDTFQNLLAPSECRPLKKDFDIEIPVIVHVFYNSQFNNVSYDEVVEMIELVNSQLMVESVGQSEDYFSIRRKVNIRLTLAKNPITCQDGYIRHYMENPSVLFNAFTNDYLDDRKIKENYAWDPKYFINIYIVKDIKLESDNNCGDTLVFDVHGYQMDDMNEGYNADGIVLSHNSLDYLIHELGHHFNLLHVWGTCEYGDHCYKGDGVPDTEAMLDEVRMNDPENCNPLYRIPQNDCEKWIQGFNSEDDSDFKNGECFSFEYDYRYNLASNYMSYQHNCWTSFTEGQYRRMIWAIEGSRPFLGTQEYNPSIISFDPGINTIEYFMQGLGYFGFEEMCVSEKEKIVKFEGTLIIDSGHEDIVCLNNMICSMDNNSSIIIKNNSSVIIENSHFLNCDGFWNGIIVEAGSSLSLRNTIIENAKTGISADKGATVSIEHSNFNNNINGIALAENGIGEKTNFSISNASFTSDDNYRYLGFDILYHRPFSGISIHDQNFVNISPDANSSIVFNRLQNGIVAYDTRIKIENCVFENIRPDDPRDGRYIVATREGFGVKILNGELVSDVSNCLFKDVRYGIGSFNGSLQSHNNIMNDVDQGIIVYKASNYSLNYNKIHANEKGIYVGFSKPQTNPVLFTDINNNEINIDSYNFYSFETENQGIHITNSSLTSAFNNRISINNPGSGILIQDSHGSGVIKNTIDVFSSNLPGNLDGIYITSSSFHSIVDNLITNFTTNSLNAGFYSHGANRVYSECNHFVNFNRGMQFWDNCDHSVMKGNTFLSNQNDLVLGNINSIGSADGATWIGPQGILDTFLLGNGNKWLSSYSTAHNSATEPIVGWSPFYVNAHVDPAFKPEIITSAGQWFYNQSNITNLSPCTGSPGADWTPPCTDLIAKIMMIDTMSRVDHCKKLMWQYRYYQELIELKKAGQLTGWCKQFLNSQQNNVLVKIAEIHRGVDSIGTLSQASADALNEVFIISMTLDSLEAAQQNGTALWNEKMGDYEIWTKIYGQSRKTDYMRDSIRTDSLQLEIGQVTVSDSCLAVLLKVFGVKLRLLRQDSLDQRDLSDLSHIAGSCPDGLGQGVFIARSIMSLYENRRYPRMEDCVDGRGVIPRSISDEVVTEEKLRVYPNPANDEVTIQIATKKGERGRLNILNSRGKMMETLETDERNSIIRINTSNWNTGIYFIEYTNSSGDSKDLQKLIIVK